MSKFDNTNTNTNYEATTAATTNDSIKEALKSGVSVEELKATLNRQLEDALDEILAENNKKLDKQFKDIIKELDYRKQNPNPNTSDKTGKADKSKQNNCEEQEPLETTLNNVMDSLDQFEDDMTVARESLLEAYDDYLFLLGIEDEDDRDEVVVMFENELIELEQEIKKIRFGFTDEEMIPADDDDDDENEELEYFIKGFLNTMKDLNSRAKNTSLPGILRDILSI